MSILGLDNGYKLTKTNTHVCFNSTIKEGIDDYNADVISMKANGKNYLIGEPNGNYISDSDKLKNDENREILILTTLAAIGSSFPKKRNINVELVVGVPIAYYSNQKDEFKKLLEGIKDQKIKLSNIDKVQIITVDNVSVYPQSVGVIFMYAEDVKGKRSIVFDIGGGTWDLSEFESMKLIDKATYAEGMIVLHNKIAQAINSQYYTNYQHYDIDKIIDNGYFIANGEKYNNDKIVIPIIKNHVKSVLDIIKRNFNVASADNIYLVGGGAEVLESYIVAELPTAQLVPDAKFSNAEGFELIGRLRAKQN